MFSARSRLPWRRLNVRLALWHSAVAFATILAVLLLTYVALRTRVEEQDHDIVLFRLNQYSAEYRRSGIDGVISLAAFRKGRAQKAFYVRIASPTNETVFERDVEDWAEFSPEKLAGEKPPQGQEIEWITLPSPQGYTLLIAGMRLADGTVVQVGKATEESFAMLQEFRLITIVMLLVSIPASFAGGAFLAGRGLRPLRALTRTVRDIQETAKFSMRAPASGAGDELDELAVVFNSAMERIERLLRTMRESLDNVAHDLRTPMTRLRNRAQLCLEAGGDPKAQQEALIGCVEESDRVLEMLDTLMDIAEAEAGLTRIPPLPVNLATIVANSCDLYSEVADDRGITVTAEVPRDLTVKGDRTLLSRAIANLLDNALKYTPRGGVVRIEAHRKDGEANLSVTDSGVGIPPDDLPKVWHRLFRGDKSRTERGLGLGLSFVKAIIEAHCGTVSAESEPGAGAKFTVRLPLEGEHPPGAEAGRESTHLAAG
jgi:heavy metal sensor kinase